jgi:protein MpaA
VRRLAVAASCLVAVGCTGGDALPAPPSTPERAAVAAPTSSPATDGTDSPATTSTTTTTPTTSTTTTTPTTSTTTTTPTTTTTSTTTTTTTTTAAIDPQLAALGIAPIDALAFPVDVEIEIGRSVEDRPITVIRRGDPQGTRVLAVGVIHGNEAAGTAIIDRLATDPVPSGVELWLVRSMNPDGQAIDNRQNAHDVDLNRNFPENWGLLGEPGDWQYAGPAPASEPETRAIVALGASVRPDLILWYHQDLFRISPGTGRSGQIRTRYAEVAGLPIVEITGGTYTGTASQWSRTVLPDRGVGITVELGPTLSEAEIVAHVAAVDTIAREFW